MWARRRPGGLLGQYRLRAQHRKSFPPSGAREACIEANEFKGCRVVVGRDDSGRKLKAVGSPQRVSAKQALRCAPYRLGRHNFMPAFRKPMRNSKQCTGLLCIDQFLAFAPCHGRCNFNQCSPPRDNLRILIQKSQQARAGRFLCEQWDYRRSIPKSHGRMRVIGLRRDPLAWHRRVAQPGATGYPA
jgi:hypothetical protein